MGLYGTQLIKNKRQRLSWNCALLEHAANLFGSDNAAPLEQLSPGHIKVHNDKAAYHRQTSTMTSNTPWRYPEILPISYQSGNITFPEWISLFTLCLAPLIAHIVAGAPRPSYLCQTRPKCHDRIC